mmetsp:Transcript_255/g.410  ORF Transcript_255/g.410 Transcript_255/m.410 type:complete len:275 (-) Transcript_255:986-1810(-)
MLQQCGNRVAGPKRCGRASHALGNQARVVPSWLPHRDLAQRGSACRAVVDKESGTVFPLAHRFWDGEVMRCLGAVTRHKQFAFLKVKVYSCALYLEAAKCAKELGVRQRGGFFATDDDYMTALTDAAAHKTLLIRLLRDVEGQQFVDALNKYLVPRMALAGEPDKLATFSNLFVDKKLVTGTEVALLWNTGGEGELDVLVTPPSKDQRVYESLTPELRIKSAALSRGLFEVFLGSGSVVPEGRQVWSEGAKVLLDSENVKRGIIHEERESYRHH